MTERSFNFCPYCGKNLPKSHKDITNFCCFCGKKLRTDKKIMNQKVQCTICHQFIYPGRNASIKCSYCGSMYHSTCVSSWLLKYNACPMCQNVFLFPNKIIPKIKE